MILEEPRKMEDVTLKCDECGKEFKPGNRPDGTPNGIGLKLQNGTIYNICADCVMRMTPERAAEIKKRGGYDADACENTCEIERKTNDTISRKRAIDAMLQLQREDDEMYGAHIPEGFDGERAAEKLKELPAEQPEVTLEQVEEYCRPRCLSIITDELLYYLEHGHRERVGRWIWVKDANGKNCHQCSECGHIQSKDSSRNFCPSCGADMRGMPAARTMITPEDDKIIEKLTQKLNAAGMQADFDKVKRAVIGTLGYEIPKPISGGKTER